MKVEIATSYWGILLSKLSRRVRRLRRQVSSKLPYVGLAVLALATAGVVAFAFIGPKETAAIPDSVATYVPPTISPKKALPIAAFFGDSYTAGVGASLGSKRWTTLLSQDAGWIEMNYGRGGTGYLTTAGKEGCGLDVCPNYAGMIPEALAAKPSIVVVSGGRNDALKDPGAAAMAVESFFTELRAGLPDAPIVVTSPVWDARATPEQVEALAQVIQDAATSVNATYVDLGQPLADQPGLITDDQVHPNDAGHNALYLAAKDSMTRSGVPTKP